MSGRTVLAGVLAGIALFVWGAVSHMVLGLDEKVIRNLPNEEATVAAMSEGMREPGLYFFPGMSLATKTGTKAEMDAANKEWMQAYATRPHGLVIYSPPTGPLSFGRLMSIELVTDILVGLLAALMLGMATPASFGARFVFVALMGLLSWLAIDVPYWNWYGFPTSFTIVDLVDQVGGFVLAGLVLAAMVKPRVRTA